MALADYSQDEIVAEVERRLGLNTLGFHGLYSSNQQDFREAWVDTMSWLHDRCNEDFPRFQPLRQVMADAIQRHTGTTVANRRRVYSVNTTFHGRSAEEDHAPKAA